MSYTQITYTNPVKSSEEEPMTMTLIVNVILWGCDACGALVWDKHLHDRWHARR